MYLFTQEDPHQIARLCLDGTIALIPYDADVEFISRPFIYENHLHAVIECEWGGIAINFESGKTIEIEWFDHIPDNQNIRTILTIDDDYAFYINNDGKWCADPDNSQGWQSDDHAFRHYCESTYNRHITAETNSDRLRVMDRDQTIAEWQYDRYVFDGLQFITETVLVVGWGILLSDHEIDWKGGMLYNITDGTTYEVHA